MFIGSVLLFLSELYFQIKALAHVQKWGNEHSDKHFTFIVPPVCMLLYTESIVLCLLQFETMGQLRYLRDSSVSLLWEIQKYAFSGSWRISIILLYKCKYCQGTAFFSCSCPSFDLFRNIGQGVSMGLSMSGSSFLLHIHLLHIYQMLCKDNMGISKDYLEA